MMDKNQELLNLIRKKIPNAKVIINTMSNSNNNYIISVQSELFNKKTKIEQHRMVFESIKHLIGNEIHAISIKTLHKEG